MQFLFLKYEKSKEIRVAPRDATCGIFRNVVWLWTLEKRWLLSSKLQVADRRELSFLISNYTRRTFLWQTEK